MFLYLRKFEILELSVTGHLFPPINGEVAPAEFHQKTGIMEHFNRFHSRCTERVDVMSLGKKTMLSGQDPEGQVEDYFR